jgi:hypothetical protein
VVDQATKAERVLLDARGKHARQQPEIVPLGDTSVQVCPPRRWPRLGAAGAPVLRSDIIGVLDRTRPPAAGCDGAEAAQGYWT